MTQNDFIEALESELQLRAVPFDRAALLNFFDSAWPLIQEQPDVAFWATEFLKTGSVAWV
jgi:hypothetical protein